MKLRKKKNEDNDIFLAGGGARLGRVFKNEKQANWMEDVYPSEAPSKATLAGNIKEKIIIIAGVLIFICLFVLLGRTFWLQILKGDLYYARASQNSRRLVSIPAERGKIFDRAGTALVINVPAYTVVFNSQKIGKNSEELKIAIAVLADKLRLRPEEILEIIESFKKGQAVPIKTNLNYEEALKLDVELAEAPGVSIVIDSQREYPYGKEIISLAQVLGYVGKVSQEEVQQNTGYLPVDSIGKTGVENFYENMLRGIAGRKEAQIDALGREKFSLILQEPEEGKDLWLTLDLELQKSAERALRNMLAARGKKRGAAVLINPKNGEILALVSLPSYDNNLFAKGISQSAYKELLSNPNHPLFPRAIAGEYPSGSTIKPMLGASALAEGIVGEQTAFLSTGGIWYGQWFFPDWKVGGHGRVNIFNAIAQSINTFFYIIGGGYGDFKGLGPERMAYYLKKFGLGKKLGIDLPGEAQGLIPTPAWKMRARGEPWYIGDTYHMAIGQGDILVTPIQLANATALIANGGTLYRPHLISASGGIIAENVINDEYLAIIRKAMRETITSGSAQKLADLPYGVAGKTGTAQWKRGAPPHAWFTGFAPWNDPRIVVTVLIEEGGEGSQAAVPVAREIFQYFFTRS